jgi:hypothetical protein
MNNNVTVSQKDIEIKYIETQQDKPTDRKFTIETMRINIPIPHYEVTISDDSFYYIFWI